MKAALAAKEFIAKARENAEKAAAELLRKKKENEDKITEARKQMEKQGDELAKKANEVKRIAEIEAKKIACRVKYAFEKNKRDACLNQCK